MLTTETLEKALSLLEEGYTFGSIMEETGITTEDAEAVHIAWFTGAPEQVHRVVSTHYSLVHILRR